MRRFSLAACLCLLFLLERFGHASSQPSVANPADTLKSGRWTLSLAAAEPIRFLDAAKPVAEVENPLAMDVLDAAGKISHVADRYSSVETNGERIIAKGSVTCPGGSVLDFTDHFSVVADRGAFALSRVVVVRTASNGDAGFRTEFEVRSESAKDVTDVEPFVPGIWYCDAGHVPASVVITDPHLREYLFREDRLPIPLASFREKDSGLCISIVHFKPDGSTFAGEFKPVVVTDDRMKFGSLGLRQAGNASVVFSYPGQEEVPTRPGPAQSRRRADRFHPLRVGFSQQYDLAVHLSTQPTFDDAMRDTWRLGFDLLAPEIVHLPMDRIYNASINLLDHYCEDHHGVPGFPFSVNIPDGTVKNVSYQMGFVGEQIPCAAHLITAGFAQKRNDLVKKGESIVDFWAANTLSPQGVPRTWYDVDPQPHWRDYETFTRIATDGMEGMLQAWLRMKQNQHDKPAWLVCCKTYADWLVTHQNDDGSFCRQYDFDGSVAIPSKSASLHPVRFLIDMHRATGDARYLATAIRAGEFGIRDIDGNANYYGGTADNDDVKDKEAGWIATDSVLSLFEATKDARWLTAAEKAATFTETWTYCWNVPIPADQANRTVPQLKTTVGMSLIATGHSASDVFLAFAPYAYYRLSIYSHEPHDAELARIFLYDARQLVDMDGSHGYAVPGLMTEASTLAGDRGHSVGVWLPWCTAAVLDPMQQLQDAFGSMDLDEIDRLPLAKRVQMLDAVTQGRFDAPKKLNANIKH